MIFNAKTKKYFQLIPIYTLSTQGIRIRYTDQLPTSLVYAGIKIFNSLPGTGALSLVSTTE
jgi:hypothetical protein